MSTSLRNAVSTVSTVITVLAFLFGAQSRLTSRFTPQHYEEQLRKTKESQKEMYTFLRISPEQCTRLIGYVNLAVVAGLALPWTKRLTAAFVLVWLSVGAFGRYRTGRSVGAPLAIMILVLGVLL